MDKQTNKESNRKIYMMRKNKQIQIFTNNPKIDRKEFGHNIYNIKL